MTHFSKGKWKDYKDNIIPEEERISMEDHLYICDNCMDIYLNLIDNEELDFAERMIPSSFTEIVMEKVEKITPISKPIRKKKMIENIFMYYVAAASVVLVLTAGGVFTKMTDLPMEKIGVDTIKTQESIGSIYSFSERIVDNTNNFVNNFGTGKKEGGK